MTQHDASGETSTPVVGPLRLDEPWYDELASGRSAARCGDTEARWGTRGEGCGGSGAVFPAGASRVEPVYDEKAAVYLAVQHGDAFQQVRHHHRRFVFPTTLLFLGWYLLYLLSSTLVPELLARPVGQGPLNVGMLAGLGQFLTTGVLTWSYVRHARRWRDRRAFELRWDTQLRIGER